MSRFVVAHITFLTEILWRWQTEKSGSLAVMSPLYVNCFSKNAKSWYGSLNSEIALRNLHNLRTARIIVRNLL
ncbi:MAG: hypothetical protein IKA46_03670 [Clostridia bacterium]|nr:hypothetical protein [Clostridia bacterium]